jgi:hypothetical protein
MTLPGDRRAIGQAPADIPATRTPSGGTKVNSAQSLASSQSTADVPASSRRTLSRMETEGLEDLRAREAIRQQLHNYCRGMDRRDDELAYAVWHADGTADYGPTVFQGSGRDFVDQVSRNHLTRTVHSHQIATIGIEVNADRAASEAYVTVRLRTEVDGGFTKEMYAGRYLDRWSRRNGQWAIDHRVWVLDFDELDRPVTTRLPIGGNRDGNDPSNDVFRW